MKKQIAILALAAVSSAFSVFGQGYVNMSTSTHRLYDQFTTPGVGVYGTTIDYAIYWALVSTADPLSAVPGAGSQYGQGGGAAVQQVATNGVASNTGTGAGNINALLTANGFTLGRDFAMSSNAVSSTTAASAANYGQFQMSGTTAGNTYELIMVGWNASAGASAILNGTYAAIGWSNPFNYLTGTSASDPNGQTLLSSSGMNQFGIAPVVPEPGTLALAALGGASLLAFRRKK